MNNDAKELRDISENKKEFEPRSVYSIEEIYNTLIYPILQAAARDGQTSFTTSTWSFSNWLPADTNILNIIKYIQEEKNIAVHLYGDTISFFW